MTLETEVIRDFAVIMAVLASITSIFYLLKQPVILGYILSGIIVGPYTPPFSLVSQIDFLKVFAEFGVILLLFVIGLDFPIAKLRSVGRVAVGVALLEMGLLLVVGYLIGVGFHWSPLDSLFLAAALSISSTTIIVKVLEDIGVLHHISSTIMIGVLIVEDLVAVVIIASLQSFVSAGHLLPLDILAIAGKVILFVGGTLIIGSLLVPKVMDKIVLKRDRQLTISVALGICFGLSALANLIGLSVATGAFLAGVVIAGARSSSQVIESIEPLKELFAALFFVSVGALMDVRQIPMFVAPAIVITLATVGAKVFGVGFGVKAFGYDAGTAVRSGLGMAQIGEFSFIVVAVGADANAISGFLFPLIGVVVIITSLLTPYLVKLGIRLAPKDKLSKSVSLVKGGH